MKYQIMNQSIPQASRQELNDKILYLIDNDPVSYTHLPMRLSYTSFLIAVSHMTATSGTCFSGATTSIPHAALLT